MVALTFKTELDSEISMSSPHFSFHLKIRLPCPLLPPPFPSCLLATLAGRDCRLFFSSKQPHVSPEHYNYKAQSSGRDKGTRTRKFLLDRYFHSVFFLSGWMMFKAYFSSQRLAWTPWELICWAHLTSTPAGCNAPHSTGDRHSFLASRCPAAQPKPRLCGDLLPSGQSRR